MASYFDVFISGSPKDNEIFPSGDDKARVYLERFFNTPEDECHSCDFYVDAIVNENVSYYSLLFRRNVIGTRTNGYFALTIRINGGYHLNIGLIQRALYYIYERYVDGKIIEEKEENKIKSYKYKVESLSNFFTKGNKESIERFLDDWFQNTGSQFAKFDSTIMPFSKTPTKNRNLYVASTSNDILLAELAKTWTLHTYLDYDKNKELENQINALSSQLSEAKSAINIRDNKFNEYNSKLGSLKNELETTKTDRDSKVAELKSIKEKARQLENEINNLRNNPKDLFERDVREMLIEILDGQEKILTNKKIGTQSQKSNKYKKQEIGSERLVQNQDREEQKTLSPKLIISWSITLVSLIVMLIMGLNSVDTEDVEKLQNDLAIAKKTISDRDNDIQNYKSENKKLTDSLDDYREKIADIGKIASIEGGGVVKIENKYLAPNYKPSIGGKSDKKFKVGNSYPVSFKNGAKYEWSVVKEGAEKEGDKVKIISKKPFTIVVKDNRKEVYRRDVYETEIVEK